MSAAAPLVTVVIPTFDRLPLLRHAVASVAAQTYPRWELVVADDGSADGTAAWVRSLADPRIRIVTAARCGHAGRVRNRGVAAGSGELVAFLDSDDVWLPRKLELQVAAMRESGARWCYAGYELMDGDGRTVPFRAGGSVPRSGRIVRELLTAEAGASIVTVVAERMLFDAVGGFSEDPRLTARGDHELVLRLALAADAVALPKVVARVLEHPGRMTAAIADPFERSALVYDLFLALRPPAELARVARRVRARHLADAAAGRLARGEYAPAARLLARAGIGTPARSLRALLRGVRDRLRAARGEP